MIGNQPNDKKYERTINRCKAVMLICLLVMVYNGLFIAIDLTAYEPSGDIWMNYAGGGVAVVVLLLANMVRANADDIRHMGGGPNLPPKWGK